MEDHQQCTDRVWQLQASKPIELRRSGLLPPSQAHNPEMASCELAPEPSPVCLSAGSLSGAAHEMLLEAWDDCPKDSAHKGSSACGWKGRGGLLAELLQVPGPCDMVHGTSKEPCLCTVPRVNAACASWQVRGGPLAELLRHADACPMAPCLSEVLC